MRRKSYKKYVLICAALFLLLSLPSLFVEKIRLMTFGSLSSFFKKSTLHTKNVSHTERLEAENHLLRLEIGKLRALLDQKTKNETLQTEIRHYPTPSKRYEEIGFLSSLICQAVPANVIYRDPVSWSSSIWINVGEETNQRLNKKIIQKNSPVIVGRSVVGAIDEVGKKQSRVRLITDVALKPSVRAARGLPHHMWLMEHLDVILRHLNGRTDLFLGTDEKTKLIKQLEKWKELLSVDTASWYLAKGILHGAGEPLWRSVHQKLRGIGFNYDFSDAEGPARELESGKPHDDHTNHPTMPIIQLNDLLITTGMDGFFPAGLRVAEVTKIFPLREGSYTYEIEASPAVGNLDNLLTVFIIPPLGYEESPLK